MRNRRSGGRILSLLGVVIIGAILCNGCAESHAGFRTVQPLKRGVDLASYRSLEIAAEKTPEAQITSEDMSRIVNLVAHKVQTRAPERFGQINAPGPAPATVCYTMVFTKYDRGSVFARAMLAGLGQIHICADVSVADKQSSEVIGKYKVDKTFALGGIVGASTHIEDCEEGFAEGMTDLILKR